MERKNIRLPEYDYSLPGAYFVTICTEKKRCILWWEPVAAHSVRHGNPPILSEAGNVIENAILQIPASYPGIAVEKFIVMPNHVHLLLTFGAGEKVNGDGRTLCAPTLGRVIKQLKGSVTKRLGKTIWQKSYYDHIVRNEEDFLRIWQYIDTNPARWAEDVYYVSEKGEKAP